MRRLLVALLSIVLIQTLSTAAQALEVNIDPDNIRQCSPAHFWASLENPGTSTLALEVTASLEQRSWELASLSIGSVLIAAGQTRVVEFDFMMPYIDQGNYVLTLHALRADGVSWQATTDFTVTSAKKGSNCLIGIPVDLLSALAVQFVDERPVGGGDPKNGGDVINSTAVTSWENVKSLYR